LAVPASAKKDRRESRPVIGTSLLEEFANGQAASCEEGRGRNRFLRNPWNEVLDLLGCALTRPRDLQKIADWRLAAPIRKS